MKSILIQNAQIIDPSQKLNKTGSLLISEGKNQVDWDQRSGAT